jgi:hypothetical protein
MFWFRARAHSASKTRVNAFMGAPRNDGPEFFSNLLDLFLLTRWPILSSHLVSREQRLRRCADFD